MTYELDQSAILLYIYESEDNMTEHIIENYDQVKAHLQALNDEFNTKDRDYYFAIGDLFNENIPPGTGSIDYNGEAQGGNAAAYHQRISREIDTLLQETGCGFARQSLHEYRYTARRWPREQRITNVAFTVYRILGPRDDRVELIVDGMSSREAEVLVRGYSASRVASAEQAAERMLSRSHSRTQSIRVATNTFRGIANKDDGSPLTQEEIELIGEAYSVLDAYSEHKGISFAEPELVAA